MELEIATVETDLFEHRQVKPHFINDCCFGEDFAEWLRQRLANSEFESSDPIQEDYGWGLWITREKDKFWIALSYVGDGPTETPAQWVISMTRPTSLNIVRWLFSKPDPTTMEALQARIRQELRSTAGISLL
ncbi:MAG TPA: hypothetical protein VJR69_14180 [Nitrospira sp.]|nr:hypothetical protein [Nitrospira sp.]